MPQNLATQHKFDFQRQIIIINKYLFLNLNMSPGKKIIHDSCSSSQEITLSPKKFTLNCLAGHMA